MIIVRAMSEYPVSIKFELGKMSVAHFLSIPGDLHHRENLISILQSIKVTENVQSDYD